MERRDVNFSSLDVMVWIVVVAASYGDVLVALLLMEFKKLAGSSGFSR